jgi:DNA helicase-2/ATP-dependent DNA helicase PcrA
MLLADLDDDQRRAVTTESELVAVVAGAGSGKTRVLTRRVAYRVATGSADEGHTVVLTFTREAAGELRRRLPRLGLSGRLTTGTFHAVAYGVLQQRWRDLGQQPRTLTADRRRILSRLVAPGTDLEAIAAEVDFACARGLSPEQYESLARRGVRRPAVDAGVVADTLRRYRGEQRTRGVIDLDDLLALTIDAIERDPGFADGLRWRFRHVLVDEAQDLNPLQHRLVDLLRSGRDDLFLVGDPAQAIYGFNGADPSLLVDVADRFPGIEVIRLPVNHRCTPQIVDAGRHALRHADPAGSSTSDLGHDLASGRPHGALVTVNAHDDEHAEADGVARAIAELDPSLISGDAVAVLARTNAQLAQIGSALERLRVPVRSASSGRQALQPVVTHVCRLTDPQAIRRWAQDALEATDPGADDPGLPAEQRVGRAIVEFLRVEPLGDGAALRAWIDANDPFDTVTAGIELLTFHGAKGREWHTVFLVGCETSLVPHRSATTNVARAEEARLLYVALTRATDRLSVNWARRRAGYQRRITPLLDGFVSDTPPTVGPPAGLRPARSNRRHRRLEQLQAWRADAARAAGVVPEALCPDAALSRIAEHPPATADELDRLTGLGALTSRRLFESIASAISEPSA